jgi:hypothetical protein
LFDSVGKYISAEEFVEVLRGKFAEKLHWYQSISINFSVAEDV